MQIMSKGKMPKFENWIVYDADEVENLNYLFTY